MTTNRLICQYVLFYQYIILKHVYSATLFFYFVGEGVYYVNEGSLHRYKTWVLTSVVYKWVCVCLGWGSEHCIAPLTPLSLFLSSLPSLHMSSSSSLSLSPTHLPLTQSLSFLSSLLFSLPEALKKGPETNSNPSSQQEKTNGPGQVIRYVGPVNIIILYLPVRASSFHKWRYRSLAPVGERLLNEFILMCSWPIKNEVGAKCFWWV